MGQIREVRVEAEQVTEAARLGTEAGAGLGAEDVRDENLPEEYYHNQVNPLIQ